MKKLTALIAATMFAGVAFAQAPVAVTTSPQGTVTAPATKGDVKAAAKLEKTEIKANEKIEKAAADAAVTGTKADAKAAKTKASARAKAQKKILAAKKDVAEAQVDASAKVAKDHKYSGAAAALKPRSADGGCLSKKLQFALRFFYCCVDSRQAITPG